jgi:hypothetical protein
MKNLPLFALLSAVVRMLALGASIGDSLAIAALAALVGYQFFLEQSKPDPVSDQIQKDVAILKDSVTALKLTRSYGK